jgi:hypothetical protein
MATWNKILLEKQVKNRTLNVMLGHTSGAGIQAGHVNFIKPIANATSGGGGHFPHLEFSDNQTLDNRAIKRWTYGRDETGSDSTTAYFDLVGNQTMDVTLNPGLANGLMGCVIPVPMGRSDVGFHDISFNFTSSHEGGLNSISDGTSVKVWKPSIWRAYANDEFTTSASTPIALRFRLVVGGSGVTYQNNNTDSGSGWVTYFVHDTPGEVKGTGIFSWRLPIHSSDSGWESKICYYMVGFHIDENEGISGEQPQAGSVQWPSTANTVTGFKQCSIIANFRVTYTAN